MIRLFGDEGCLPLPVRALRGCYCKGRAEESTPLPRNEPGGGALRGGRGATLLLGKSARKGCRKETATVARERSAGRGKVILDRGPFRGRITYVKKERGGVPWGPCFPWAEAGRLRKGEFKLMWGTRLVLSVQKGLGGNLGLDVNTEGR